MDDDDDNDIMNLEAIVQHNTPIIWTRKLTSRMLNEFKRLAPKVGDSIKSMNMLHALIAKTLINEFKCELTPAQVGNKLKSIKRKFLICKEKGRPVVEFGPGLEEILQIMDRVNAKEWKGKRSSYGADRSRNEAAVESIKASNDQSYSIEIMEDTVQNETEIMDISQFLNKHEAASSKGASYQDPLEGDVIDFGEKARRSNASKLSLLEKKIETQEKSLEEKLRKNELIEERNRLIATLLTKKTKSDVVDAIRKDRLLHHNEMRDLWAERLEVERKKLEEKKRRNDLLEERNKLMKSLLESMTKKTSEGDADGSQSEEVPNTIELE